MSKGVGASMQFSSWLYILLAILLALHPAARVTLDYESKHTTYGVLLRVMF